MSEEQREQIIQLKQMQHRYLSETEAKELMHLYDVFEPLYDYSSDSEEGNGRDDDEIDKNFPVEANESQSDEIDSNDVARLFSNAEHQNAVSESFEENVSHLGIFNETPHVKESDWPDLGAETPCCVTITPLRRVSVEQHHQRAFEKVPFEAVHNHL
jgi:hypothetical protein